MSDEEQDEARIPSVRSAQHATAGTGEDSSTPKLLSWWSGAFLRQYANKKFRDDFSARFTSMLIAIQVRELRLSRGLTQQQFAEKTGVPQATISRLESGFWEGHMQTLLRIAEACDVALIGRFVSHGEFLSYAHDIVMSGVPVARSFDEEAAALQRQLPAAGEARASGSVSLASDAEIKD